MSEMDRLQDKVLSRARELTRIKAGKASQTPGNPETTEKSVVENNGNIENGAGQGGNLHSQQPPQSADRPDDHVDRPDDHVTASLASASNRGCLQTEELWEKLSSVESKIERREKESTDLFSNIIVNLAKLQRSVDTNLCQTSVTTANITVPDTDLDELDDVMGTSVGGADGSEENSRDDFLGDLESYYKDKRLFGQNVDGKLATLVGNAIDRPLSEDALKVLEQKYLVPENCKKLCVPKVNRELWNAFRSQRVGDIAMQATQQCLSMAMVPVIKSLEIMMNKGDINEVRELTKDTFRVLAHGVNVSNRKRKALIRPAVPAKYRKVCEGDSPVSEYLFGDDLEQKVDDIEKEEKRAQKLGAPQLQQTPFLGQRAQRGSYSGNRYGGKMVHRKPATQPGYGKPYRSQGQYSGKPNNRKVQGQNYRRR